jgi:hypothetical protein
MPPAERSDHGDEILGRGRERGAGLPGRRPAREGLTAVGILSV